MKIDRLLSIIVMMLNRDRVSAAELARHFEVSVRTVYRDLESIDLAGIPIVSFQGNQGGYCIHESYKLDRRLLTQADLVSILSALKGVSRAFESADLARAFEKVKSLVPRERQEEVDLLQSQIVIDILPWGFREKERLLLAELHRSVEQRRPIEFSYLSSSREITKREVEPHTLVFKGYAWYLYGWCRLRKDFRLFRVSRIRDLRPRGGTFARRAGSYDDFARATAAPVKLAELTLLCSPELADAMEDYVEPLARQDRPDGRCLIRAAWPEGDWMYSMLLGMGAGAEVVEPAAVRAELARRARATLARYAEGLAAADSNLT